MTYVNTIRDLEASTYGIAGASGNALLKSSGVVGGFGTGHDTGGTTLAEGFLLNAGRTATDDACATGRHSV
mgnify:CR=1 FL=1